MVPPPPDSPGPESILHFIDECFAHSSRTLYIVGLEKLANYQWYVTLPYPKVILQSGLSIGTPDESCLLIMYVDCSSQTAMFTELETMMRGFTRIIRNGKYIVLVDDIYLSNGNIPIAISLGSFFATYNVVYWAVTGINRAEELQYTLFFASNVYYMNGPLTHGPVFEWNRGLLRNTTFEIHGQAIHAFPYTHHTGGGKFRGIDISIFKIVMERIGCLLQVHIIERTADIDNDVAHIMNRLHQMTMDVMVTRRNVHVGTLPVVYIADYTYYCLVAPRSTQVDLTRSLLRPFSSDVWWFIIVCTVVINVMKEVLKYDTQLGILMRQASFEGPIRSFYRISFTVICFVLIEAYLTKVTSFFLTYRFLPDARTLDEFFATDTPIRLEEGSNNFLSIVEPRIRDLIVARGINSTECEEFSSECAHLDSFARASYMISENIGVDADSGRKRSYIVPEMIASYNYLSYCFARGSTLTDLVAVYLQRMYETGLMRLYHRQYEQYLLPNKYVHVVSESSLEFDHLTSVWICVSVGWGISVVVFLLELVQSWLVRTVRKGRQFQNGPAKRAWNTQKSKA
uniref:Ionotropic glutamate receptor C-terminal domain-containing protein n=1 Tax=Anopheles culicifacies TaxID=139723 RepID=A0A182LZD9_9DIPT